MKYSALEHWESDASFQHPCSFGRFIRTPLADLILEKWYKRMSMNILRPRKQMKCLRYSEETKHRNKKSAVGVQRDFIQIAIAKTIADKKLNAFFSQCPFACLRV